MNQAQKMKNLINNTFELAKTIDGVKTVYISGDFTSHYVKKMFGDVYCYYDNTNDLKQDWTYYNSIHGDDVIRLFEGLKSEYNPIENYDRYEDSGIKHRGTIGNTGNSTSTSKTSAYDSDTLVTDGEISGNTGNTTTFNNDDTTTSHIHGNIGVVDAPSMLSNESRIRFNNFIEHYINKWLTSIIVGYGSEDNEIEFAPDTEYAKKSEFDALAENVNTIGGKVGTLETNYDTLNNSVGGVISDIDNNIKPSIEDLIDEVDNTSAEVDDHETRITALESAPSIYPVMRDITSECTITVPSGTVAKKKVLCDGHNVNVFLYIQGLTRASYAQIADISHPTINFDIGNDINMPLPIAHISANPLNLMGGFRSSGGHLILSTIEQSFNNVWVWIGFSVRLNN